MSPLATLRQGDRLDPSSAAGSMKKITCARRAPLPCGVVLCACACVVLLSFLCRALALCVCVVSRALSWCARVCVSSRAVLCVCVFVGFCVLAPAAVRPPFLPCLPAGAPPWGVLVPSPVGPLCACAPCRALRSAASPACSARGAWVGLSAFALCVAAAPALCGPCSVPCCCLLVASVGPSVLAPACAAAPASRGPRFGLSFPLVPAVSSSFVLLAFFLLLGLSSSFRPRQIPRWSIRAQKVCGCVGARVRGCVGAWVRGCAGAWVRGCVGARVCGCVGA